MRDFVIVGSGVSGGRVADDLTAAGARVLMLEAGKRFEKNTFPANEFEGSTKLFWNGGIEVTEDGQLGLLRAKCVGGTSIVNQALVDRFDEDAFSDWRSRSGIDFLSMEGMRPHYEASEAGLSIESIPEKYRNRNAHLFTKACDARGIEWQGLRRAQGDCALERGQDCMVCLNGCPRDSKQSSLVTTIRRAESRGLLEVKHSFEALEIEEGQDFVTVRGMFEGRKEEVHAKRAFLAAGAIGNSALLLRSGYGSRLPALGKGFSCHPQFMSYGVFDEPVDAHKGAFQAVKSQAPSLRKRGFKLENVFAPPIGTAMLVPGYGKRHQEVMSRYRSLASMEVCTRDEPLGRVSLKKDGRIRIEKPLSSQDRSRIKDGLELILDLFREAGAKEVVRCDQGFGLHLMGGCVLGTDPRTSTVAPDFRLHGSKRIFAADSSVFPSAPGINPSLTILALSHRAAKEALA